MHYGYTEKERNDREEGARKHRQILEYVPLLKGRTIQSAIYRDGDEDEVVLTFTDGCVLRVTSTEILIVSNTLDD